MTEKRLNHSPSEPWPYAGCSEKAAILTDNDLDGIAAAVIVASRYRTFTLALSSPSSLCQDLASFAQDQPADSDIFVLDLAINHSDLKECISVLTRLRDEGRRVFYVDTHRRPQKDCQQIKTVCTILSQNVNGAATTVIQQTLGTPSTRHLAHWAALAEREMKHRDPNVYRRVKVLETAIPSMKESDLSVLVQRMIDPTYNPLEDTVVTREAERSMEEVQQTIEILHRHKHILSYYPPIVAFFGHKHSNDLPRAGFAGSIIAIEKKIVVLVTRRKKENPKRVYLHGRKFTPLPFNMEDIVAAMRDAGGDGGGHGPDSHVAGWVPRASLNNFFTALKQRIPALDQHLHKTPVAYKPWGTS